MTSPVTLQLLITPLVLGQDTVPDPARGTNPPNNQNRNNTPTNTPAPVDGFFPNQGANNPDNTDQRLEELGRAFGTVPAPVRRTLEHLRAHYITTDATWLYLGDQGDSHGDFYFCTPRQQNS